MDLIEYDKNLIAMQLYNKRKDLASIYRMLRNLSINDLMDIDTELLNIKNNENVCNKDGINDIQDIIAGIYFENQRLLCEKYYLDEKDFAELEEDYESIYDLMDTDEDVIDLVLNNYGDYEISFFKSYAISRGDHEVAEIMNKAEKAYLTDLVYRLNISLRQGNVQEYLESLLLIDYVRLFEYITFDENYSSLVALVSKLFFDKINRKELTESDVFMLDLYFSDKVDMQKVRLI